MNTMNDEVMGALMACGGMAAMGGLIFLMCHDDTFAASDKTKRFWKWWTLFWFAPVAFRVLSIVWLG